MVPMRHALIIAMILAWPSFAGSVAVAASDETLTLVPWPKSVKRDTGDMTLTGESRIVFADGKLEPLAKVLSGEVYVSTAFRLKTVAGSAGAGDIELQLDTQMQGEKYTLSVTDRAIVRGGNYRAVAWGAATLLQAIEPAPAGKLLLPRVTVEDEPLAAYRGLMIDVARVWHPVESLRAIVEMCRLYKINYLQLHLNDQESFTFPSKAFPKLATSYKGKRRTYTREELEGLVRFADERGVTLVPEIEGPGHHSGALRNLWGRKGTSCMDMASEKTYEGMDTLIGEVCDLFASSPYVHIGADECDLHGVGKSDEEQAFMESHGLKGATGLYNYYIVRMNEIVRKHGRQTICWEGFHGDGGGGAKIPKDILVMPFESTYNPANKLVSHGYSVINTAWKPLYVVGGRKWPAQYIYENWNLRLWEHHVNTRCHIQLKPGDPVLGAQMCAWEQGPATELPSTRERIHAMSERIWNPDAGKGFADFTVRAAKTDKLLDRLVCRVEVKIKGLPGKENHGYQYFWDPITVELSSPPVGTIRYTLDGTDPAAGSIAYSRPITITGEQTRHEKLFYNRRIGRYETQGDVVRLKARIFDAASQPLGDEVTLIQFWRQTPAEMPKDTPVTEPE